MLQPSVSALLFAQWNEGPAIASKCGNVLLQEEMTYGYVFGKVLSCAFISDLAGPQNRSVLLDAQTWQCSAAQLSRHFNSPPNSDDVIELHAN